MVLSQKLAPPFLAPGAVQNRLEFRRSSSFARGEEEVKRKPVNISRTVSLIFALFSCLTAFAQDFRDQASDKVFVGYVYRPPANINFKLYTHLCHAFITADENGVVRTNRNV